MFTDSGEDSARRNSGAAKNVPAETIEKMNNVTIIETKSYNNSLIEETTHNLPPVPTIIDR